MPSRKVTLARFRRKRKMSDQTEKNEVQPEEINNVDVPMPGEEANVPEVSEEKKSEDTPASDVLEEPQQEVVSQPVEKDPSFNCVPCKGEGLIVNDIFPEGKICDACKGTGKV